MATIVLYQFSRKYQLSIVTGGVIGTGRFSDRHPREMKFRILTNTYNIDQMDMFFKLNMHQKP